MFQGTHGEENQKAKKTRRQVVGVSRAIGNTSLEAILAKRNQKPEFRRAQREQAVKSVILCCLHLLCHLFQGR